MAIVDELAKGALKVGQRQPHKGVPTWVTPVVMRGGFASRDHAAGGELMPHELAVGGEASHARERANGHFLTRAGLETLGARLSDRAYRIAAPEEGALLVVRWLIERGENESAARLIEKLAPFFDRLRFHPQPSAPQPEPTLGIGAPVLVSTTSEVAASLRRKAPQASVEAMREAYEVWAPITDAMVALVRDTMHDGMPFAALPPDFDARRVSLLTRYAQARVTHTRCKRPHRRGEVLEVMQRALSADDAARGWTVSQVKNRLDAFVAAYGAPGSEQHARLRASQRVGPSHATIAHVVAERLEQLAVPGEGLEPRDQRTVIAPVDGSEIPEGIGWHVDRAIADPLVAQLTSGRVRSAEAMALLLPQLSGPTLATRWDDPRPRALFAALYRAFRNRRSLLLLSLQHQVRLGELPWVAALESTSDRDAASAVRELLRSVVTLAIETFPGTQMPNKLVSELTTLVKEAGLTLPLIEEVAADIFMGTFSIKFLRAAQLAARALGPTSLYARYFGLPYARVLAIADVQKKSNVETSPTFDRLCVELADRPEGGNPRARNGTMIEQASILSTHNLAGLVDTLDIRLDDAALALTVYTSVLDRLERRVLPERIPMRPRMRSSKQLAFAWRQMLFFLSRISQTALEAFVHEAKVLLDARSALARERFGPILQGLDVVAAGGTLAHHERLYGWSVGPPRLLTPPATSR